MRVAFRVDDETTAKVDAVETDMRGNRVATVGFDGLDRITRSRLLRGSMEQERREIAGE